MRNNLFIVGILVLFSGGPDIHSSQGIAGWCLSGDCVKGRGIKVYRDGAIYEGEFRDGLPQGKGLRLFPSGRALTGNFVKGKEEGDFLVISSAGKARMVRYCDGVSGKSTDHGFLPFPGAVFGSFTQNGIFQGWYYGDALRGRRSHGWGVMDYSSTSRYAGQWCQGAPHGNGTMTWQNGNRYSGAWNRGRRTGIGTYQWITGAVYQGEWLDNMRHGRGIHIETTGTVHEGLWVYDRFAGAQSSSSISASVRNYYLTRSCPDIVIPEGVR